MPRRKPDPHEAAATRGDAYIAQSSAIVGRACHAFLMERDPNYAAEYRRNSARAQSNADRRKR